ncbi:MAG: hypothetical protein V1745_03810 [Patescibacteria group bacterium]
MRKHIIDCDAPPFAPERLSLAEEVHQVPGRVTGKFTWNPATVALHLDQDQQGGLIIGTDLAKRLADKKVLPAQVLDHLLAHPKLIPKEWRGKSVCFWGTVYRDPAGCLWIRFLSWDGRRWCWFVARLTHRCFSNGPAAVSAS